MTKLEALLSSGIVAVLRKVEAGKVLPLVDTLAASGISGVEITVDSEKAYELIKDCAGKYKNTNTLIGAGTVLHWKQAELAIDAGAQFILSPILDRETVEYTKSRDIIMVPGVFSPSEILKAYVWGADVVKLFPARALGPQYIKDISAPLGHIPFMPTGGVDAENIGAFMQAGAAAAGVGGSLINQTAIKQEDWGEIARSAKQLLKEVEKARK